MSIATELTLLANSKQAIKNSINQKGGSITDSTPFADYSTAIDNLPSGGSGNPVLTSIDVSDFSGTTFKKAVSYITDVTIPSGVTSIEQEAFFNCSSLTSINIPSSVTSIGQSAFSRDFDIATACVDENNTKYYSPNDCDGIIDRTTNTLILATNGMTVPSTVTKVVSGAINATSMYTIKFLGTTPPSFEGSAVNNEEYGKRAYVYVPEESVSAYKAIYNLSQYSYIDYERPAIIQNGETLLNSDIYSFSGRFTYGTSRTLSGDVKLTDYITYIETDSGGNPYTRSMGNITSFDFNENPSFTVLVNYQFERCTSLKTLVLSSYITKLNFHSLPENLEILTCRAVTPPTYDVRSSMSNLQAIYVPAESVDAYKTAWANFASIIQGLPSPTPSVTSITFAQYKEATSPDDRGDFEGCNGDVNVDAFESTGSTGSDAFDSDIKAAGIVLVEDNNGNDITSQCTFSSNDYSVWDSTTDPEYDGESEAYYEWRLDASIGESDEQSPQSATITATYGNLSDTFTIEWTTTSNCEEPEPEPEPDPEEPEE